LVCICLAEKFGEGEPSVFSYVFPQLPRRLKHYWSPNGCWDGARGRCEQCSWTLCERLWRRPSQCTVWIGRICHSHFWWSRFSVTHQCSSCTNPAYAPC
jgi:hypothetical protein